MSGATRHAAPTFWTPLPAGFPTAPKVATLLAEFGAAGPYCMVVLLAHATAQMYGALGDARSPGRVRLGWPTIVQQVGLHDVSAARAVVQRIAALGEIEMEADDDVGFSARFVAWELWHPPDPKDPTAARRQQGKRDRDKGVTGP